MIYTVVSPFSSIIYGDSIKEAIKNFVLINDRANLQNIIFKDQMNHYEARIKYYKQNQKNKVGITVYPYNYPNPIIQNGVEIYPLPVVPMMVAPMVGPPVIGSPGMISANQYGPVISPYNYLHKR
jgi:hypothetical protein